MTQDFASNKRAPQKKPRPKVKPESRRRPSTRLILSLSAFILFGSGLFYLNGIHPEAETAQIKPTNTSQQVKNHTQLPKAETINQTKTDKPPFFTFYTKLKESQNWGKIEQVERRQNNKTVAEPQARKPAISHPTTKLPGQQKKLAAQYILQAGSFSRFEDANNQRVNLIMKGVRNVRITTVTLASGKTNHRIEMGPFTSEKELKRVKSRLNSIKVSSFKRRVN